MEGQYPRQTSAGCEGWRRNRAQAGEGRCAAMRGERGKKTEVVVVVRRDNRGGTSAFSATGSFPTTGGQQASLSGILSSIYRAAETLVVVTSGRGRPVERMSAAPGIRGVASRRSSAPSVDDGPGKRSLRAPSEDEPMGRREPPANSSNTGLGLAIVDIRGDLYFLWAARYLISAKGAGQL